MNCRDCSYQPQILQVLAEHGDDYEAYESEEKLTWCTGCGNFGIQNALKRALTLEGFGPTDVLQCFDIGCNGNGSDKIHGYTLHGLHGRVLPIAAGAALANTKMKVVASAGDGATFSEGVNHLVHAIRNDYPLLFIIHNNENYGLTTGQPSATTREGFVMNAAPEGVTTGPLNPMELILSLKPTFAARTFSGMVDHMTEIFRAGLKHRGLAIVEVMQICTTYNPATSHEWFWQRIRTTDEIKRYDKTDLWQARRVAEDLEEHISLGILYQDETRPNFHERQQRDGAKTGLVEEVRHRKISKLMKAFE